MVCSLWGQHRFEIGFTVNAIVVWNGKYEVIQEGREQRQVCGQKLGFHPTKMMISAFGVESQTARYIGHVAVTRSTYSESAGCRHSVFRSKPACDNSSTAE
jgi:hypothetical protein